MRWETVPTTVSDLAVYRLMDGELLKVTLKYNSLQHTVRVDYQDTRRLFFIQQHAGILRSKTVFTNEYGLEVGKLSSDKWLGNTYTVELEGTKYHVGFRSKPFAELVVYKKSIDQPLITCDLRADDSVLKLTFDTAANDEASSLLLGLCWYLFAPVAKENLAPYAISA